MLRQNLAKNNSNWEDYDDEIAFGIFIIEKEFHVGMVDETFPLLKFWNLFDDKNLNRYKRAMEKDISGNGVETW
jgi:hypothetical protein